MALRRKLKAIEQRVKDSRFYLVFWEEESNVSVHSEKELKEPLPEGRVGDACSIKFGRIWYTGKIAYIGTKLEMLAVEKAYLKGDFTPFKDDGSVEVSQSGSSKSSSTEELSPSSTAEASKVATSSKPKRRKRKLISDKTKKVKGSKGQKKQRSNNPSKGKKKKGGSILAYGSGAESNEIDSDDETDSIYETESENEADILNETEKVNRTLNETEKDQVVDSSGLDDNSSGTRVSSADPNVSKNSGGTNIDNENATVTHIYEGTFGGEYPEYQSDDSSLSTKEVPMGKNDDAVKKLTLHMESLEEKTRDILWRLQILEHNQYGQGYMVPPPWVMGQQYSLASTSCLHQSYGPPPLITSQQSTGSDSSSGSPSSITSNSASVAMKENTALPPIDHSSLISPQAVVDKYPKMLKESKIPTLSIRLAQQSFFGKEVMSYCTFRGIGSYHALPETEVKKLKEFLKNLTLPSIVSSRPDFEILWKKCIESIGQSCKSLRKLRLANLELK